MEEDVSESTVTANNAIEISQKIKFSDFTKTLEKISLATVPKKSEILRKFIDGFNKLAVHLKQTHPEADTSFFPILRLLLPKADRERDSYGIKVPTMAKLYVRVLGIAPKSEEAKMLTASNYDGDYASVVYDIMVKRAVKECLLSVWDVNYHLDVISECFQSNNRKKIDDELIKLISKLTALDQKWLIRIILKDLRMGLGQAKIFSIYHPLAKDFHARQCHLSKVCQSVESGENLPTDEQSHLVHPFQPVRPMLCQRINFKLIDTLITDQPHYLETKMDGERFQLHMKDEEYRYFSRNSFDYTHIFGADFKSGTLTPLLPPLFQKKVNSIILDGEMMVWNMTDKIYHTKSENYDAKSLKTGSNLRAEFCVYDILYFNDKTLIGLPYGERVRLMGTLFEDHPGVLTKSKRTKITDNAQFQECLNAAIDAKEEGVVLKAESSTYKAGERNAGWYKIKPDYIEGFICDFDCLIIGGYYNRKRTYIHKYLLAVMADSTEGSEKFHSVTKVASGLTMVESRDLNASLKPHWNEVTSVRIGRRMVSQMPPGIEWNQNEVPDVWIEPKKSIVLQLKASELVKSDSFRTDNTLRFPRIVSIRSDKPWKECCTLEEFNKMCDPTSKVNKLTTRHVNAGDMLGGPLKTPEKRRKRAAATTFQFVSDSKSDEETVAPIDNICAGLDFCVMTTKKGDYPSVAGLKKMVRKHNGRIVENPGPSTFAIIAGDLNFRVQKTAELKKYDIVSVDWALRALKTSLPQKRLKPFHPHEMIAATFDTAEQLAQTYDEHGDSYEEATTSAEIKFLFNKIKAEEVPNLTTEQIYDLEQEIFGAATPNIFRTLSAYFASTADDVSEFQLAKLVFRSKGGAVLHSLDESEITHVVVDRSADNESLLSECAFSVDSSVKIVDFHFIYDCATAGQILDYKKYLVARSPTNRW